MEVQSHVGMCCRLWGMEHYLKPWGKAVIECIIQHVGATVHQPAEHHLAEEIHTDSGSNKEAIAVKK